MPEVIVRGLQDSPILLQWYSWGVIGAFVGALIITGWIFVAAQNSVEDATLWKSLAAVATVICIPALLARVQAGFAFEMRDSLALLAGFSMAGAALAIVALVGFATTRARSRRACDVCGRPQSPGWTHCPYHASSLQQPTVSAPVRIPAEQSPPRASSKETMVSGLSSPNGHESGPIAPQRATVILSREQAPRPLALLIIDSGPYANTTLPLGEGATTLGRDGTLNDYPIDDDAVSTRHLSVRYRDGRFVATDLDSANGTYINDQQIDRRTLEPNDVIRLGRTRLVFVQIGAAETGTGAPA